MKKILLTAMFFAIACMGFATEERNAARELRCEALDAPLGIDSTLPHFSWKANVLQRTWQIQVASSLEDLEAGNANLWDSGEQAGSECVMIPYSGKELKSRQLCWWRVSINGNWSKPERFSVGIIGDDSIDGDFIGAIPQEGSSPIVYTTFKVKDPSKTTFLHVNSLGYHEVYVNGKRIVEAPLTPAVSQLDKRSLIVTYDITSFLQKGKNDIAIWMASGWYKKDTFKAEYEGPLARACVDVLEKNGWKTILTTNPAWKAVDSGYCGLGTWRPGQFGGEKIEAAKVPADLSATTLDGMHPMEVDVVKPQIPATVPQMCSLNISKETIPAVSVEPIGKDKWLVDMGKVMNAQLEARIMGVEAGGQVRITYSDAVQNVGSDQGWGEDILICSGKAEGDVFRSKFNHHVFRYAIIEGTPARPSLRDIKGHRFGACDAKSGSFHCSDPDLDRIHDMIAYTMDNLVFSGYMVDCASIERLGYGGDGNASALTLQTIYDIDALYMNWLQAWMDTQGEDGHLRHVAPSPNSAGGGPYWCSFIVQAPWRVYMSYADKRLLERCYSSMLKWIGYVDKYSVDGLLRRWPDDERRTWYLGDWLAPRGTDVTMQESVDLVNNCAVSQSYEDLIKIALILGKEDDSKMFTERKAKLDALIHDTFYHPDQKTYGTGSQLDMIYPMLVGAVPSGLVSEVRDKLVERCTTVYEDHLSVGLVGVPVLAEWAARNREADLVMKMLKQRSYPGYLYMIDNGATATWEDWDNPRSQLHNCFNGMGSWFYQALGGIIQDAPGFKHVIIDPQFPEGLDWVRVSQETPYGTLNVSWQKKEGKIALHVEVPFGMSALVAGQEVGSGACDMLLPR